MNLLHGTICHTTKTYSLKLISTGLTWTGLVTGNLTTENKMELMTGLMVDIWNVMENGTIAKIISMKWGLLHMITVLVKSHSKLTVKQIIML